MRATHKQAIVRVQRRKRDRGAMGHPLLKLLLVGLLVGATLPGKLALAGSAPGTGIVQSVHDFTNPAGFAYYNGARRGDASICVFCHVPHRNSASPTAQTRLLWNHTLSSSGTFKWSDVDRTVNGTLLPAIASSVGMSKLCLSCHDGTVSVGDVYRANGVEGLTFTDSWTGAGVDASGKLGNLLPGNVIGGNGDLKGNHPVGIPFPYGSVPNIYNGVTTGAGIDYADYVTSPVNVKLFTDVGGDWIQGATDGRSGIECASCHDPHNKKTLDNWLLRDYYRAATGAPSQLCLDCHNK